MTKQLQHFGAIETMYRSFNFRSRLEAKWAVFFDLCGWSWSYEPPELHGYIPDFAVGERPTLVEVKPFYRRDQWGDAIRKLIQSGCRMPVVMLGADAQWVASTESGQGDAAPCIGWLAEPISIDGAADYQLSDLHFGFTDGNRKLGLCPLDSGWVNQIWIPPANCSAPNKWSRVELEDGDYEKELTERWANACNGTRWMKK